MLGATLLSGIGQWIVLFPISLIVFEVKIRMEEHLMGGGLPRRVPPVPPLGAPARPRSVRVASSPLSQLVALAWYC
jgi:hypothetical protein